jgi:copper chaperone
MKKIIKIEGMSCQHCVMAVKKEIQKLDVTNVEVKIGEATVEFDENKVNEETIKKTITFAGYVVIN